MFFTISTNGPYYSYLPDIICEKYPIFDAPWSPELMYFLDDLETMVKEELKKG